MNVAIASSLEQYEKDTGLLAPALDSIDWDMTLDELTKPHLVQPVELPSSEQIQQHLLDQRKKALLAHFASV